MTNKVEYKTPSGNSVTLEIVTERASISDENTILSCWDLVVYFAGEFVRARRINHARGPALSAYMTTKEGKVTDAIALIPSDKVEAVDALLARFNDGVEARRYVESDAMRAHQRLMRDMDRADSIN